MKTQNLARFCESALLGGLESLGLEGLYFLQKQKVAKTLFWVLRTDFFP